MCRKKGYGFLSRFGLKTGIDFDIMVLNRVWFSREPRERINVFVFQLQMNSREREVSKICHSSRILSIVDFVTDAKLNYGKTKV